MSTRPDLHVVNGQPAPQQPRREPNTHQMAFVNGLMLGFFAGITLVVIVWLFTTM